MPLTIWTRKMLLPAPIKSQRGKLIKVHFCKALPTANTSLTPDRMLIHIPPPQLIIKGESWLLTGMHTAKVVKQIWITHRTKKDPLATMEALLSPTMPRKSLPARSLLLKNWILISTTTLRSWCLRGPSKCSLPRQRPSHRFQRAETPLSSVQLKRLSWWTTQIPILTRTTNGLITCKKWMNLIKPSVKSWACCPRTAAMAGKLLRRASSTSRVRAGLKWWHQKKLNSLTPSSSWETHRSTINELNS